MKWHTFDADVLPMFIADMDFASPAPVIQALRERVEHGVFGYPDGILNESRELAGFRELMRQRLAERYGWQTQPEDYVFAPGVIVGFNLAGLQCSIAVIPDLELRQKFQ